MGLAAIVLLQNGLRLSAWPAELAGISTGLLLILTIVLQRLVGRRHARADGTTPKTEARKSSVATLAIKACIALVLIGLAGYWVHRRQLSRTAGQVEAQGKGLMMMRVRQQ
jgi:rhamnose transport system permease protein